MKLDEEPSYYLYRLTMDGRSQTGVVGCCLVDEYFDGSIKKHELTRPVKEDDRVRVRFGDRVYPLKAVLVGRPGELEGFDADRYVYRLDPR